MLGSRILVILLFFASLGAFGHGGDSTLSSKELLKIYEKTLERVQQPFYAAATNESAWFLFEGKMIAFDYSRMEVALKESISDLKLAQKELEKTALPEAKTNSESFFKRSLVKFKANLAKAPFSALKLLGASQSMLHEHGFLLFAIIAVTQTTWEALESVVSVSIGAGGAHVACTIFNAALLATATSLSKALQMSASYPKQIPLKQKLGSSFISFIRALKSGFALNKAMIMNQSRIANNYNHSSFEDFLEKEGIEASEEEEFFIDSHFIAPVWAAFQPTSSNQSTQWVDSRDDIRSIFSDDLDTASRFLVLEKHIRGIKLLPKLINLMAEKTLFTPEQHGQFAAGLSLWKMGDATREYLKVRGLTGEAFAAINEYRLLLEPIASIKQPRQYFMSYSETLIESIAEVFSELLDVFKEMKVFLISDFDLQTKDISQAYKARFKEIKKKAKILRRTPFSCQMKLLANLD